MESDRQPATAHPARWVPTLYFAEGVPFFVVSCAQALREGTLQDGGAAEGVPWDLAQGLRQRVVALAPEAREVLGVVAVAGGAVSRALLSQVVALPEREVLAALEAACDARLLEEAGPAAYRFTHDVIREVVEASLGAGRRMLVHRDIARALAFARSALEAAGQADQAARLNDDLSSLIETARRTVWTDDTPVPPDLFDRPDVADRPGAPAAKQPWWKFW